MAKPTEGTLPQAFAKPSTLAAILNITSNMKKTIPFFLVSIFLTNCVARLTADKMNYLKNELEEMAKFDQIAAYIPQGKYKEYTQEQWQEFKDSVFTNNKIMVEKMFHKYGFLGYNKVGKDGSHNFWSIIQHCGKYPEFQKKVLKSMDIEVKKGNANPNDYAYLYDRVKVNAGEKQLFGTQVIYETKTTGRAVPKVGLVDSANVDRLRRKYNLEPLKEYLNSMTINHYEMNKEHYLKIGIVKPYIY